MAKRRPTRVKEAGMVSALARRDDEYASTVVTVGEDTRDDDQRQSDEALARVQALLRTAQERYRLVETAEATLRRDMLEDLDFVASEQWPENIKTIRVTNGRPCLTINRLTQFIRQVVNTARANKPAIQVNPVDSGADPDVAEALQGIARHIEITSGASMAYETASEHQARMGRGWIRVVTEWDDDEGFQQTIRIKRVRNPFSIYMDPGCQELDYSDAEYAIVTEDISRTEYKRRFRKSDGDMASLDAFMSAGDVPEHWLTADRVRIAEYWYTEYSPYEIVEVEVPGNPAVGEPARKRLVLPATVLRDQRKKYRTDVGLDDSDDDAVIEQTDIPGLTILQRRTVMRRKVKMCVISAMEILEGNEDRTAGRDWPGKWIPIVPVLGDEIVIRGRTDLRGMVRDAKDPQRMYNYWASSATEQIALAPRAPYIGYEGQFAGHESKWARANTHNFPYLEVKPVTHDGKLASLPQRKVEEPAIQATMIALRQADYDLKAVMGMFDPSLGQASGPEESGKAVLARQRQGEVANSNYADNLARAIRRVGYIIVDLAPKIYAVPTVLRILGDDTDKPKPVMVYAGKENKPPIPQDAQGQPVAPDLKALAKMRGVKGIYDLAAGRYDVTVTVGPSYPSRRAEAVDAMLQVLTRSPELMPAIGDLVFANMDWPGSKQIAKRLARGVPPHLRDPEEGEEEIPPQAQQQITQLQQQVQELTQILQQFQQERQAKAMELQAKGQIAAAEQASRERIAAANAEAQLQIAAMEARTAQMKIELQAMADKQQAVLESQLDAMLIKLEGKIDERLALAAPREAVPA